MMGRKKAISSKDPITAKAIALYRNGASVRKAAAAVFLSPEGLRYRFRVLGIPSREKGRGKPLASELVERIREERKGGKTYRTIAREYGLCAQTVRKYAKDLTHITINAQKQGRRISTSLEDPLTQKAVELYQSGITLSAAAAAINISPPGLEYRFKVLGISTRETHRGKELPAELVEKIRREHRNGKSQITIAKELGVGRPTVRKYTK